MSNLEYDVDQITTMDFKNAMRRHVAMYAGSADNNGVFQVFKEVLGNSIDEFMNGFGTKINVVINDNKVSIRDEGRGIPFSEDEKDPTFIDIFTSPHTSGKFNHAAYKNAVGLHGLGAKLAALSSEEFEVHSHRNGKTATLLIKKGEVISYKIKNEKLKTPYTYVSYIPDAEVFHIEKLDIDPKRIIEFCRISTYLNPGLVIEVLDENKEKKHLFKASGIGDLIKDNYPKTLVPPNFFKVEDETDTVEICYTWVDSRREKFHLFVNGMEITDGGSPITGFRSNLTRTFNSLTKQKISGENIRQGIVYIINIKCLNPSFSDQRKSQIQNPNLRTLAGQAITESLKEFSRSKNFETMTELLIKIERADAAAERARKQVLETTREIEQNQKKKVFSSDKLKDAEILGPDSTLYLVEGNSAASIMAVARDPQKSGILALRGKLINALSNPPEKVLENEEVKLIMSALNVRPNSYRPSKLRYGKIGITTDADADGSHIALLIMAFFQAYLPEFLKDGRLYWLRAPLHIRNLKSKDFFYYSDEELKNAAEKGGTLSRAKGLGSLTPNQAKEALFGKNRRFEPLKFTEESFETLEDLMGKEVDPRREFVFNKIDFSSIKE